MNLFFSVAFCFRDRLIGGAENGVCDKDCMSEARLTGLTFSVGRLLHSITETLHAAATPDITDQQCPPRHSFHSCRFHFYYS